MPRSLRRLAVWIALFPAYAACNQSSGADRIMLNGHLGNTLETSRACCFLAKIVGDAYFDAG